MPDNPPDPRVYFAAQRTMLAWLRTGIAIMAFGFVVARFGLFLRLLHVQGGEGPSHGLSPYIGAALILLALQRNLVITAIQCRATDSEVQQVAHPLATVRHSRLFVPFLRDQHVRQQSFRQLPQLASVHDAFYDSFQQYLQHVPKLARCQFHRFFSRLYNANWSCRK